MMRFEDSIEVVINCIVNKAGKMWKSHGMFHVKPVEFDDLC